MRPALVIKEQPQELSKDKAWLLGHVAGDGNVRTKSTSIKVSVWAGVDRQIAEECAGLFLGLYGTPSTLIEHAPGVGMRKHTNYEIVCYRKAVVEDLLSYAPFGVSRWRVPEKVLSGTVEIKGAWVSGFFDADGTVGYYPKARMRRVSASSINREGLEQVMRLLSDLEIKTSMTEWEYPAKDEDARFGDLNCNRFTLNIYSRNNLEKFSSLVGFRSSTKQRILNDALASYKEHGGKETYYRGGVRRKKGVEKETLARRVPRIAELRSRGVPLKDIGRIFGFKGDDSRVATLVSNIINKAKKAGVWPEDFVPAPSKEEERLPRIAEMRKQGMKLKEIGRALGLKGTDQQVESLVSVTITRAKKKGLWPL